MTKPGRLYRWSAVLICAFSLTMLWEVAARSAQSPFFPPPSEIAAAVREMWFSGPADRLWVSDALIEHAGTSVSRLLLGFTIAVVVGAALGLAVGTVTPVREALMPVLRFVGAIPPPALLPVALVVFGISDLREIFVIAIGCVWPVLLGAMTGAASVDPAAREAARVLQLSRGAYVSKVLWPAVFPQLANGIRIALGFAMVLMVVSELAVASSGIGFSLVQSQRTYQINAMWASVVLIAAIGIVLAAIVEVLLRRPLRWHYAMEGR